MKVNMDLREARSKLPKIKNNVAVILSGGMDSSIVTMMLARHYGPEKVFALTFNYGQNPDGTYKNFDVVKYPMVEVMADAFVKKAQENKLQPSDWDSNTFTISNLGMFGIDDFTAIINPPDACILAVGAIKERPIVKDGSIVSSNIMRITLSCDHRVVDGVVGSKFLQTLKDMLESPLMMFC